jgi:hypothetical protein
MRISHAETTGLSVQKNLVPMGGMTITWTGIAKGKVAAAVERT